MDGIFHSKTQQAPEHMNRFTGHFEVAGVTYERLSGVNLLVSSVEIDYVGKTVTVWGPETEALDATVAISHLVEKNGCSFHLNTVSEDGTSKCKIHLHGGKITKANLPLHQSDDDPACWMIKMSYTKITRGLDTATLTPLMSEVA
jgi:hypothetical protein